MQAEHPSHEIAGPRQLRAYIVSLLLCLGGVEVTLRACEPQFEAASHRARFKTALLLQQPKHEVVVLGSSRLEMAFSPSVFAEGVRARGVPFTAFVAAIADTSVELLEFTCQQVEQQGTARLVLIELSEPMLRRAPLEWAAPSGDRGYEERFAAFLRNHSVLWRLRTSFRLENLARLALLQFFGNAFDGSEHSGLDFLQALRSHRARPTGPPNLSEWPLMVRTDAYAQALPDAPKEEVAQRLAICARELSAIGARVAFVVPPTRYAAEAWERSDDFHQFAARVTALSQAPVLDYAAAATPSEYYRDWTHLLESGRVAFTQALTEGLWNEGLVSHATEGSRALQ